MFPAIKAFPVYLLYSALADFVVIIHFAYAAFIVLSVPVIWIGWFSGAKFVRNPYFRLGHLICMLGIFIQTLAGIDCPLTILELRLRVLAGGGIYTGSFIQHWINRILFHEAPPAVFTVAYGCFLALVLFSFIFIRPDTRKRSLMNS